MREDPRMTSARKRIIVFGLSLSSSWGNGHATTWRALLKALADRGHDIMFFERDVPWYRDNSDLKNPAFCELIFYRHLADLDAWRTRVAQADAVIVGSYVPDGIAVGRFVCDEAHGVTAFYDIDTPVTLASLDRNENDYLTRELITRFDLYLSFSGGATLDRLQTEYGAQKAVALYCSVDDSSYRPVEIKETYDLAYLGTYSEDRQPALERLLIEPARRAPSLRFAVAGPQYPKSIEWPSNVTLMDHVAPSEHPAFYSSARFALNVTRQDMVRAGHSPSVRLFEAAACGSAIISDRWAGIESVLSPPDEIVIADDTTDVLRALAMPEPDRCALAAAGRQRVLSAHTAAHRALELESHLFPLDRAAYGGNPVCLPDAARDLHSGLVLDVSGTRGPNE
jgi:spore maturation protein CgeB